MSKFSQTRTLLPAMMLAFALMAAGAAPAEEAASGKTVKVVISVEDMSCTLCVTAINHALRKTEGVIRAKTSLKTKKAEVIVPEGFPTDKLLEAVKETGYTGQVDEILPEETNLDGSG
jgi:mercuric ion binding protein